MSMAPSPPIIFVGEAQGANEAKIGRGFVGTTGAELLKMLHDASVITFTPEDRAAISRFYRTGDPWALNEIWSCHPEITRTNVFNQHPPANRLEHFTGTKPEGIKGFPALIKSGYVRKEFQHELDRLGDELISIDPNLVVALGNTALWALAGRTGVTKLRGTTCLSTHTVANYKLLTTYHPSAVCRQWELRPTTVADLMKINKEKEYPDVRRPRCEVWIEPTLEDIETFIERYVRGCSILSVDIETAGNRVTCIGFAPRRDLAIVIPLDDERSEDRSYWKSKDDERRCWGIVRSLLEDKTIPKVMQNSSYDVSFLWRAYGIRTFGLIHDTLLLHHALQPESLKSLGYMGSLYTDWHAWKTEHKDNRTIKRDN